MIKSVHIKDFASASAVLRDPSFSTFDLAEHLRHLNEHTPQDLGALVHSAENNPFFLEGPRLRRLHLLVAKMLAPQRMPLWKPVVERAIDKYLDELPGKENPDLVRDFVEPVFRSIMGAVLGFDSSNVPEFTAWIRDSRDFLEPLLSLRRLGRLKEILDQITIHLEASTSSPRFEGPPSLSAELMEHLSEDFTKDDATALITVLMIVGQATPHTLANMVLYVLQMPEERRLAATGANAPAWFDENLEMLLRLCSAIRAIGRVALRAGTLGDTTYAAGDLLHLEMLSANHDASVFPMDNGCPMAKRSSSSDHLVFGSGRHTCPGAPLARLVIGTALTRLFTKFPHAALASEPTWEQSTFLRTASVLPCTL